MAVPLMPAGGRIVFVTSHQAHFFPHKAVPKGYTAVAAIKRAGEATLNAMRPELHRAGVHFTVVSGDMIDDGFRRRDRQRGQPPRIMFVDSATTSDRRLAFPAGTAPGDPQHPQRVLLEDQRRDRGVDVERLEVTAPAVHLDVRVIRPEQHLEFAAADSPQRTSCGGKYFGDHPDRSM